ncbi:hypothetical protein GTU71_02500 [Rathayibacter sp. VKM Ac-2762]|uniref:hypothetical protein n=1 Tax=Rathayibacter sp. VKM Ac-2762 TaxID=2609254 RepID=UPI00132F34AF|nr:hypothetical protein [Rathayibacter sp. VKM Ac-2762]QHF19839.1 hypothetical protein GTU71_02500 [Rathayibacter sp. VKM Ac-2762]
MTQTTTPSPLATRVAALEAENARLRAELEKAQHVAARKERVLKNMAKRTADD